MNPTPTQYRVEEKRPSSVALSKWVFNAYDDTARGNCVHCNDPMVYQFDATLVAQGPEGDGEPASQDGAPRKIECSCGMTHPGNEGKDPAGCGRYWFVRILPKQHPPITPEHDDSVKHLAEQLASTNPTSQEQIVRAAAEKWIAGVTALLGLFGLGGIAFGKDVFAGIAVGARWVLAVALLVAVVTATLSILRIYRAAYGWPHTVDVSNVHGIRKWARERRAAPGRAADNLRGGVYLALASLLAICVGAAAVWWHASTPTPLIKATLTDESIVCGELLDTIDAGKLRVRRSDTGSVEVLDFADLKLAVVQNCS